MKKIMFLSVFIFLSAASYSQFREIAPGVAYGTEIKSIGFMLKGVYQLPQSNFHLNGEFVLFSPKTEKTSLITTEVNWWEVNANFTYPYALTDYISVYPLTGLNIMHYSATSDTRAQGSNQFDSEYSEYEIGLNFGAGFYYYIVDNFYAYWEGRYMVSDYKQAMVTVGIAYRFGKTSEE